MGLHKRTLGPWAATVLMWLAATSMATTEIPDQEPRVVEVQLSNSQDEPVFIPNQLEFTTGQLYRLVLHNAGSHTHHFSSPGFSRSVFTHKLQVVSDGAVLVEFKGEVREIEIHPGATAEWWLVPIKPAHLDDLSCDRPGHEQEGMTGSIHIQ